MITTPLPQPTATIVNQQAKTHTRPTRLSKTPNAFLSLCSSASAQFLERHPTNLSISTDGSKSRKRSLSHMFWRQRTISNALPSLADSRSSSTITTLDDRSFSFPSINSHGPQWQNSKVNSPTSALSATPQNIIHLKNDSSFEDECKEQEYYLSKTVSTIITEENTPQSSPEHDILFPNTTSTSQKSNLSIVSEDNLCKSSTHSSPSPVAVASPAPSPPQKSVPLLLPSSKPSLSFSRHPSTVIECKRWIIERCQQLLDTLFAQPTSYRKLNDVKVLLESTDILLNAMDPPNTSLKDILEAIKIQFDDYRNAFKSNSKRNYTTEMHDMIMMIQKLCQFNHHPPSYVTKDSLYSFTLEAPHLLSHLPTAEDYATLWPDHIDPKAAWFRQHFNGRPYTLLIGPMVGPSSRRGKTNKADDTFGIISIIQERAKEFGGLGNKSACVLGSQFRIIARGGKTLTVAHHIVHETLAKDTQTHLETIGAGSNLDTTMDQKKTRSLYSLSSSHSNANNTTVVNHQMNRLMRASIMAVCPGLDLRLFKEIAVDATMNFPLEKDLLHFDEVGIPKCYKFGVLAIKDGQTTEEEWFSNTGLSEPLETFMNSIGARVELYRYSGYTAGLDTKSGESGETSYVSKWREHDIMFHVAPLMPFNINDKQQVHRKRYLGNDVACVVFIENNQVFDPSAIRSQFLHIFIVVHPEEVLGKPCWRVQIIRKQHVPEFGPLLPSPPLFYDKETLANFIILKLVNGENAALKSEKFAVPNMKARTSILKTLVDSGLSTTPPPPPPLTTTNTTTTHTTTTTTTTTTTPTTLNPLRRITKDESVFLVKYAQRNSHEAYEKSRKSSIERSMMITPTDSSSSSSNSSFGHGYTWKASSSEKMPTGRASPPFPAPSRSSLLKDLKSFTKRRNGSSPPLKDPVVPVKTVTTKKEKAPSPLHSKSTIINTSDRKEIKSSGLNKLSRRVKSQSIPPKSLQQVQPNINSTPRTSLPAKTVQAKTQHGRKGVVELISSKKLLPSGPNISATILHLHAKK